VAAVVLVGGVGSGAAARIKHGTTRTHLGRESLSADLLDAHVQQPKTPLQHVESIPETLTASTPRKSGTRIAWTAG